MVGAADVLNMDKHRAYKDEQRVKILTERARVLNPDFSPQFSRDLKKHSVDLEDARKPPKKGDRFKVVVSGHVVEVWEFEQGVVTGKKGDKFNWDDNLYDPETGEILYPFDLEQKRIDDAGKESSYDPEVARRSNARRAKNELRRLILANFSNGSKFVTLTFRNGAVKDVTNVAECNGAFDKFMKRLRREYKDFRFARVIEFQDSNGRGAVHYHVLFEGLPYVKFDELAAIWGNGFIGINRIDHVDNVGAYVLKYMVKDMDDHRLFQKKAYSTSHNLVRPIVLYGAEAEEIIEKYLANKKAVFTNGYVSEYQGQITYQEFNLKRGDNN
jgi:hypothetical protein